ncbi:MAG: hypothetical protein K2M15_01155 [Oscillospiraceae bacterium]|nr:hypothetical protein [Oscillospiraceae bacterium]MDE7170757.1 hypothetical protein [Oscillospiraceae bacterium]
MAERVPPKLTAAFLGLEGVIYAAFLALDLTGQSGLTIPIKYVGILLCLAFALLCALRGGDRLVPVALALTAGADWFLLVRNDCYALGIVLFLCVQTVYFLRLRRAGGPAAWPLRSGLALGAGLAVYAAGMAVGQAAPVNLLAALYFSQLLSNTALAWTLKGRPWRLFALGLTLFVGCDACVGLFNVLPAASPLFPAASVGMWLFYLPSQVLIALSALPEKEVSHEENQ